MNSDSSPKTEVIQSTKAVMMCKPCNFGYNTQTAVDNHFMREDNAHNAEEIQKLALQEWEIFGKTLKEHNIPLITYDDTEDPRKPDSIFCRDWQSFHESGLIVLYPLRAENRRHEVRMDVLKDIIEKKNGYVVKEVFDLREEAKKLKEEKPEEEDIYLEGSGAILFDNPNKRMYVVKSKRTHPALVDKLANKLGFEAITFKCKDADGVDVYHTDVLMSIGENFAILCEESFVKPDELNFVKRSLKETGHEIVPITLKQMGSFAGNCYECVNENGEKFIIMSKSGYDSLDRNQVETLSKYAKILPLDIHTIEELGGGSVRCMSGDIRLPKETPIFG